MLFMTTLISSYSPAGDQQGAAADEQDHSQQVDPGGTGASGGWEFDACVVVHIKGI